MRIRLSNRSYEDAAAVITMNGKRNYHTRLVAAAQAFHRDDCIMVIAEKDDQVVGFMHSDIKGDVIANITSPAIRDDMKETNVLDSLVAFTLDQSAKRGVLRVYFMAHEGEDDWIIRVLNEMSFKTGEIHRCPNGIHHVMYKDLKGEKEFFDAIVTRKMNIFSLALHLSPAAQAPSAGGPPGPFDDGGDFDDFDDEEDSEDA